MQWRSAHAPCLCPMTAPSAAMVVSDQDAQFPAIKSMKSLVAYNASLVLQQEDSYAAYGHELGLVHAGCTSPIRQGVATGAGNW